MEEKKSFAVVNGFKWFKIVDRTLLIKNIKASKFR
jgi:hypothetical protein